MKTQNTPRSYKRPLLWILLLSSIILAYPMTPLAPEPISVQKGVENFVAGIDELKVVFSSLFR